MTGLFADIGWFEFQSRYQSLYIGFPYTVVWIGTMHSLLDSGSMVSLMGQDSFNHYFRPFNPSFDMWAVNFLFITSRATGTGIVVHSGLTSKETSVSSELIPFPLRLSANPLLSLTKDIFLPVYLCKRFVRNFDSLWLDVPQADIMGLKGTSGLWIFSSP